MSPTLELNDMELEPFKKIILEASGFSFEKDRLQILKTALLNRMDFLNMNSLVDYQAMLNNDQGEIQRLIELLTVNETYFFRESEYLNLITKRMVPELLAENKDDRLKIVSAGCSTGEEIYSIAMLLNDIFGQETADRFILSGVDIDGAVISKAIKGSYGKYSLRAMAPLYLERYFEKSEAGTFNLRGFIKKQVTFQAVNLISERYPEFMMNSDVILYRNVSIYFSEHVQEEIFRRLANCLKPGGYLIVSATETMHHNLGILCLLKMDDLFVYRKVSGTAALDRRRHRRERGDHVPQIKTKKTNYSSKAEIYQKADSYLPAKDTRTLFDDALEHVKSGRPQLALFLLDELISMDKSFVNAHALKASLLIESDRLSEAQKACQDAVKNDAFCISAFLMLGIIAFKSGENEIGLKHFRNAVYLDSQCWPAHFYLAEIVNIMGEKRRAVAGYQAALEILKAGQLHELGSKYFPLVFNAQQFLVVCQHKLDGLTKRIKLASSA